MGSKKKSDPAVAAIHQKKHHIEAISDTGDSGNAISDKKKKKHNKDKEVNDFLSGVFGKVQKEEAAEEAPKKKKKSKTHRDDVVLVEVAKSPKKHSKSDEMPAQVAPITKSPSKKRHRTEEETEPSHSPKKKHKKSEQAADIIVHQIDSPPENIPTKEKKNTSPVDYWPHEDLNTLFSRMRAAIPKDDKLSFHTRQEKIDWNAVAFGDYSGEDCKTMWLQVTRSLRGFRLLSELITDAEAWAGKPWTKFGKKEPKTRKHPDEPHKPLSAYMLYYMAVVKEVQAENPGSSMGTMTKLIASRYKSLSPSERKKYDDLAAEKKKEYLEKMKIFQKNHPEMINTCPKKSRTPVQIFMEERAKKFENSGLTPQQIRDHIKEKWKVLSEKKRVKYIKKAVEEHRAYQEELKEYLASHPESTIDTKKTAVLSRKELDLLLKDAGRPEKPPSTVQRLFMRDEHKVEAAKGTPTDQIFGILGARFKELTPSEKQVYIDRLNREIDAYKKAYAAYMSSLSEEQREYEELVAQPVKIARKEKERKPAKEEMVPRTTQKPCFPGEPEKPPSSAYQLFLQTFVKDSGLKAAEAKNYWSFLPESDKAKFVAKQKEMMEKYMVKFESFLKSLSKEQLTAYKLLYQDDTSKDGKNVNPSQAEKPSQAKDESSDSESDSSDEDDSDSEPGKVALTAAAENESSSSDSEEEQENVVGNNIMPIITKPVASSSDSDSDDDDSDSE